MAYNPVTVHEVLPAFSVQHQLTRDLCTSLVKDDGVAGGIYGYGIKTVTSTALNAGGMMPYRLMSTNVVAILQTRKRLYGLNFEDISSMLSVPERLHKEYSVCAEGEYPHTGEYAMALFKHILQSTMSYLFKSYGTPVGNALQMVEGLDVPGNLPAQLPTEILKTFAAIHDANVLAEFAVNTREEKYPDAGHYVAHLYACCVTRAIIIAQFEKALFYKLGQEMLDPNVCSQAKLDLTFQQMRKTDEPNWFFPRLDEIQKAVFKYGLESVVANWVTPVPYDLLCTFICLGQIAGFAKVDVDITMDALAHQDQSDPLFHSAGKVLRENPGYSIAVYTDCGGTSFHDSARYSDIDDHLALLCLHWFCKSQAIAFDRIKIVMCDKPEKSSREGILAAFPGAKIEQDTADGTYIQASHTLLIGPVHIWTLRNIFHTSQSVCAVTAGSGVNGKHSGSQWQHYIENCNADGRPVLYQKV